MPEQPEKAQIMAVLQQHAAEWRGDEIVGRVRWICACRELRTDDFDEYRAHVADLIIEHVFRPGVEGTS